MSNKQPIGSSGGKVMAIKQRNIALTEYYKNPIMCKYCKNPIPVLDGEKVSTVRRKTFCNRTCKTSYSNHIRALHNQYKRSSDRLPLDIYLNTISVSNKTKRDLFSTRTNWQSARSAIQKHARNIYLTSATHTHCCRIGCMYEAHIDVAHIKPVSEFSDDSLISNINDKFNLMGLCKNHHWEFDHNLITLDDIILPY
jgi:hypothetical protein